jgi:predicted  nucleic acid-binding Zn-ribbon protein
MGPTNVALVKLFRADQQLRAAQENYESAARSVRILERKVKELTTQLSALQHSLREQQTKSNAFDLDLKSRDAHIEKLRTQQQQAKTNKEYQAFLAEINTAKVDRNKVEDEAIKVMESVERTQGEFKTLQAQLDEEQKKLAAVQAQLGGRLSELQGEIDKLRPARDAAYQAVQPRARQEFERLAERHEGEAMSALEKPDRRREEYVCGACQMSLVVDVYNRLHSRDELVACTSCGRLLYIPEDLPPEVAVNKGPAATPAKEKRGPRGGKIGAAINRQSSAEDVVNSVTIEDDDASTETNAGATNGASAPADTPPGA